MRNFKIENNQINPGHQNAIFNDYMNEILGRLLLKKPCFLLKRRKIVFTKMP